jgi:threonine/homoserine/homoserine lactone efflux protein
LEILNLPAFIAASVLLMFIPGVDMALVTRQVVMHGRRAAFGTLAGLLVGGLAHAAFATIGLSAVLLASSTAYATVKLVGAAYLVAVGIQTLRASRFNGSIHNEGKDLESIRSSGRSMRLRHAFLLGFLSDITNPKVAVFFLTFLPQFVTPNSDATIEIAFLGVLFNAIATSWWIGYVLVLDRFSEWIRRSAVRRIIERITGLVLVFLGLRVAIERR